MGQITHVSGRSTHTLGQQVRRLRQARGWSLRQLALVAGVDFSWLGRLERDQYASPDPRLLLNLARALDVEAAELHLAAGYGDTAHLPGFAPYLRAKYDLPDEAVGQLEAHFELIHDRYRREKGGDDGRHHRGRT